MLIACFPGCRAQDVVVGLRVKRHDNTKHDYYWNANTKKCGVVLHPRAGSRKGTDVSTLWIQDGREGAAKPAFELPLLRCVRGAAPGRTGVEVHALFHPGLHDVPYVQDHLFQLRAALSAFEKRHQGAGAVTGERRASMVTSWRRPGSSSAQLDAASRPCTVVVIGGLP